jgi:hypothetical protein
MELNVVCRAVRCDECIDSFCNFGQQKSAFEQIRECRKELGAWVGLKIIIYVNVAYIKLI